MSTIILDKLIDDMNNSPNHSFIFVIERSDRAMFLAKLPEDYYDEIYKNKSIRNFY